MRTTIIFFIFIILSSNLATADVDWVIEQSRVGPINIRTTEEDLVKIYGAANVVTQNMHAGEVTWNGTVVFPNEPTKKLIIDWINKAPNRNPRLITLEGNQSKWVTLEGISLGTPLADIVRLNGQPVELMNEGTSWDFDGREISDVMGGNLKGLVGQGISIHLQPAEQSLSWVIEPPYQKLRGQKIILSNNPLVEKGSFSVQRIDIL